MRKAVAVLAGAAVAAALDNGLALTPQMGYNSWYDVECSGSMNETWLRQTTDALVEKGLVALGYQYMNLDDCWASKTRSSNGTLVADPSKFPSGTLKELADYVHSKGMLFGTYTDRGTETCAGRPAALGNEERDAQTYASWGVDYLKEDSCHASTDHQTAFRDYGKMRDALNKTGRPVLFSLCGWESWYAPVGASIGNSWRTGPDDTNWAGILANIDIMPGLEKYAGPGAWNDPCLLLSYTWEMKPRVTELQTRAQFSMWAVLASPLLISGNVLQMTAETLQTYSNKDVIAVNQDPLGKQGSRLHGGPLASGATNVWARPLSGGRFAMVLINTGAAAADVTCDAACFAQIGVKPGNHVAAKDLWHTGHAVPDITNASFTAVGLAPQGGHMMLLLTPA
eukprot:TRINITY_DN46782_c0_g1_i1.p1 TRINITY_DN46782_c0_g1~~TRINITY_DN46782_c0_g1_i1.p1  ORF type:complete len:417 (+),score=88.14 TRINITY_DN46782_c0_g1_i1:63-1253(+)